jgi:hypothetical protein
MAAKASISSSLTLANPAIPPLLKSLDKCEHHIVQEASPLIWSCHVDLLTSSRGRQRKTSLLAHWPKGALAGKHHGRTSSAEPSIVVGSFSTDDTADGHEETRK